MSSKNNKAFKTKKWDEAKYNNKNKNQERAKKNIKVPKRKCLRNRYGFVFCTDMKGKKKKPSPNKTKKAVMKRATVTAKRKPKTVTAKRKPKKQPKK